MRACVDGYILGGMRIWRAAVRVCVCVCVCVCVWVGGVGCGGVGGEEEEGEQLVSVTLVSTNVAVTGEAGCARTAALSYHYWLHA